MSSLVRIPCLLLLAFALIGSIGPAFGQIYSYLDDNGVRVFTNIPPAAPVRDLKVSGSQPAPPAPQGSQANGRRATATQKNAAAKTPAARPADLQRPNNGIAADPVNPPDGEINEDHSTYAAIIEKYSNEYGVDPKLIHSMIATESAFNPRAVSPKGAQGLMQLMPGTAAYLGVANPFDPEENISGGIRYMRSLLDMFSGYPDGLMLSLAAYNAGENLVRRLGRVPAIQETNNYVRAIIQRYGQTETVVQDPMPAPDPAQVQSPTFRYFDEKGILVLTNIPPVLPSGNGTAANRSQTIFR
jgi:soluble lytic murein transglycosylase-like protein